jgi:histone-lysine N-methyltransferase SETMAR
MASIFWDMKGMLMVKFMKQGTTITSEVYCETLKKVRRAIQNKRCGMLTSGVLVVLLHDCACPHTATRTGALLEPFNWQLFDHPPCSPFLTPSNYHLFTYLKNWLGSQCFNNNEELMEDVKMWLSWQAADFFGRHTKNYFLIWQMPQFWRWLCWEVAEVFTYFLYIIQFFFSLLVLLTAHHKLLSE